MSFLSPTFNIHNIRIGYIAEASCLNMGNNFPVGFQSYKKQNQGFGEINGDCNDLKDIKSLLKDTKLIDILNEIDKKGTIPDWMEPYIKSVLSKEH